jgi:hypothetical protein
MHLLRNTKSPQPAGNRLVLIAAIQGILASTLVGDLLQFPFHLEGSAQRGQVLHDVLAALDDGVLRGDGTIRGDAEFERREERVGDLVR